MTPFSRFNVVAATPANWPEIIELLEAHGLPVSDLDVGHASNFLLAKDSTGMAGCIGCERHGAYALLRSLAVRTDCRNQGIGTTLTIEMEGSCKSFGVSAVYLLTETAAAFAGKQGYRRIDRTAVPEEIRSTRQFSELCPCCAVCMAKTL